MQTPLEITFRNMDHSDAVEARIREKVGKLEQVYDRITACRVRVEAINRQHTKGNLFQVNIELSVPGKQVMVGRNPGKNHAHEDVYVAVRDAFNAARRRLEDHSRRKSGKVKTHEVPPHGKVARLFPYEGYGFIETPDGREIYFHENSLVDSDFAKLEEGQEVRYVAAEKESEKGPQASTVKLIGKHHLA
ncbi:HPF/RaiA family ribosome-associated protein [Pelagibius marinus]|uniref:HPF/RaiA family ribosome-associated protein n=1 Tax=Pelagibius marinus TaxID=2762760 RepID=UPI001872CF52|nr:HPF/RaiA family ribosome-associated protein [Pelagibius marinus]